MIVIGLVDSDGLRLGRGVAGRHVGGGRNCVQAAAMQHEWARAAGILGPAPHRPTPPCALGSSSPSRDSMPVWLYSAPIG